MKDGPAAPRKAIPNGPNRESTVPEKVDLLFRTIRPGGREYSLKEVQEGMRALGYKVSDSTLQQLRSGSRPNPTHHTLEALCKFFGVPAGYFFDETEWETVRQELELLASLRDQRVRAIATRAAGLSPDNLALLGQVIETIADHQRRTGGDGTANAVTTDPGPAR